MESYAQNQIRGGGGKVQQVDPHEHYHGLHSEAYDKAAAGESEDDFEIASSATSRKGSFTSNTTLSRTIQDLQRQIKLLEQRVSGQPTATEDKETTDNRPSVKFQSETGGNDIASKGIDTNSKQVNVVPEIRETTWAEFTNKLDGDETEFAIEVLVEEPVTRCHSRKHGRNGQANTSDDQDLATAELEDTDGILRVPDRIRINSPHILSTLGSISNSIDTGVPIVMLHPFKFLVQNEKIIRTLTQQLADGKDDDDKQSSSEESLVSNQETPLSSASHGASTEPQTVLPHMCCLISFMEKYVMPTVLYWRTNVGGNIRFRDLWYIFQPGEDIFMPIKERHQKVSFDAASVAPDRFHGLYQFLWRVTGCGGGRRNLSSPHHRDNELKKTPFKANCYHIDYDGKYFTPIVHAFPIEPYKGERDVTSLIFFPLRFLKQAEEIHRQSLTQARQVFDALVKSHTHFYYVGPTMTRHPCDCPLLAGNDELQQDHIESEVIVDYRTVLLKHPSWAPKISPWKQPPTQPSEVQDRRRINYWVDKDRSRLARSELDNIFNDNSIDRERADAFRSSEGLFRPIPSAWLSNEKVIPDHDIALLACRVYAFVLRTRTFAPLWLWGLESIKAQNDSLRNLQLQNNSFKDTMHALVRTHFLQKSARQRSKSEQDAIRGKGKGLVFLLHGAPGVGKTFTAESVAAANGRPLFQITCGDLGLTPIEVEKALSEIFRFAQLWDCVLLLDECDIFLTQRTKNDLKRNSLVSVFLRVLEFYTGVLFLTTNRVGMLDSAIKSRITWSTYYPPLDLQQTRQIWKINLDLLEMRNPDVHIDRAGIFTFAKKQFQSTIQSNNNWNGRQIQNAFKVAMGLAKWDAYSGEEQQSMDTRIALAEDDRIVKLTASHFETIATAVDTFERYLQDTLGRSEAQRAYDAQERTDNFNIIVQDADSEPNSAALDPSRTRRRSSSQAIGPQKTPHLVSDMYKSTLSFDSTAQNGTKSRHQQSRGRNSADFGLSPAAAAMAAMAAMQPQFSTDYMPSNKRKRSDGQVSYAKQRKGSGNSPLFSRDDSRSNSEFEDTHAVEKAASDDDDDWSQ